MAESIVYFVLDQLSTFLREEGRLLGGIRHDVQFIRDELEHMRAFLKVAEAKEDDDPRLQVWINQVREAAYDAEDVLDEFVSRFGRHHFMGFYGFIRKTFKSIKNLRARYRVASEIQSIRSRIMNISKAHQRYQSEYDDGSSVQKTWCYSRDEALLVEESKLVGIEKPKQHLISKLLDGESKFKVISVVGMGGLGKTTLVKKVHDDPDFRRHFPVRAWVTVSQRFDFQELLKNLIRQLHMEIKKPVPQMVQSLTSFELKEFIKSFLQQVRYSIVFDDVWDVEFWNEIKFALPESSWGNRVILTTRIADVASASCIESQGYVYMIKPLSFEESWTLFSNKVFRNDCCPAHLKSVVEGILHKCEGLPLAIVAISGVLAVKDVSRVDEWEMVRCSLGDELEGTGKLARVKKILSFSYNYLPSHLKTCLLYLSIFPEDLGIECRTLIHLWIAERFVERRGVMVEDVAYGYLRELVNRSLIQVTEMIYEGKPWTCRIHDLLREVILSKSREQNLVTLVAGKHTWWPTEKVRRLVIHSSSFFPLINNIQESQHHYCFNQVRSVITFGSMELPLSKTLVSEVLSSSKLLKVLDLGNAQTFEEIPNEIFDLFHLNHLSMFGTRVKTVPKSIGKLQNLEYLDLGETKVRELPTEILMLKQLGHLVVGAPVDHTDHDYGFHGFKAPPRMGALLSLQCLAAVDAATENEETRIVKEVGKLRRLRKLGITNLRSEDGKELCSSLANLTNLRGLSVSSTGKYNEAIDLNHGYPHSSPFLQSLRFLIWRCRLEKMPEWITHLQGLVRIDLIWSCLKEDPLESLQHLPSLVRLYLSQAYQGEGLRFKAGGFLKLKELWLKRMEGLRRMEVEEGAMPQLQKLILQEFPLLEDFPVGFQHLNQLQEVQFSDMSSKLVEKLENQNNKDIAFIPEIAIFVWKHGECSGTSYGEKRKYNNIYYRQNRK